jgi:hypothetical protein
MKKIMNLFVLSCKRATELIEKKQLIQLNAIESIQLRFHKKMCRICTTYEEQSLFISAAIDQQQLREIKVNELKLSEEMKTKIQQKIRVSGTISEEE